MLAVAQVDKVRSGAVPGTVMELDEPITVDPEVQIGRSLRLPREVFDALLERAGEAGLPRSTLVKQCFSQRGVA